MLGGRVALIGSRNCYEVANESVNVEQKIFKF